MLPNPIEAFSRNFSAHSPICLFLGLGLLLSLPHHPGSFVSHDTSQICRTVLIPCSLDGAGNREELGNDKCPAWLGLVAFSQSFRISTGCHQCSYFSHAIDSPEEVLRQLKQPGWLTHCVTTEPQEVHRLFEPPQRT